MGPHVTSAAVARTYISNYLANRSVSVPNPAHWDFDLVEFQAYLAYRMDQGDTLFRLIRGLMPNGDETRIYATLVEGGEQVLGESGYDNQACIDRYLEQRTVSESNPQYWTFGLAEIAEYLTDGLVDADCPIIRIARGLTSEGVETPVLTWANEGGVAVIDQVDEAEAMQAGLPCPPLC